jgi:two-component system LytT family sensor kinase
MTNIRLLSFEKYFNSVRQNRLNFFVLSLSLPWLVPLVSYLIWGNVYFTSIKGFLTGTVLNLISCLIVYNTNRVIGRFSSKIYPESHQSIYRVTLSFPLNAIVIVSILYIVLALYNSIKLFGYELKPGPALWSAFVVLAASLIGAGLTELAYTFMQWKTNQHELQQLEQSQLQSELKRLNSRLIPIFCSIALTRFPY